MLLQSLIWGLVPERFLIIYTLWAPPFHESYFILWNSQEGETCSSMTPVLISITLSAEPNKLASSLSHDISSEMWRSTILSGYSTVNRTSFSCSVTWSHLRSPIPLSTFPFYLFFWPLHLVFLAVLFASPQPPPSTVWVGETNSRHQARWQQWQNCIPLLSPLANSVCTFFRTFSFPCFGFMFI